MFERFAWAVLLCAVLFTNIASAQSTGPFVDEDAYLQERASNSTSMSAVDAQGLISSVQLTLSDQVDGKCWTNVDGVRDRLRAELERSGISAYVEPLASGSHGPPN